MFFFPPLVTGLPLPLSRDFLIYIVTAQVLLRLPCGGDFIGVALASQLEDKVSHGVPGSLAPTSFYPSSTMVPESQVCVWVLQSYQLGLGILTSLVLCLGHLWLSGMVSVCRLVPSTGNLMSILLNKNLLVELFDHMVDANFNFWKNSHCLPQH